MKSYTSDLGKVLKTWPSNLSCNIEKQVEMKILFYAHAVAFPVLLLLVENLSMIICSRET